MSGATIHLGFAVPSGAAVEIPMRHMAVCGQTQEAGKTTALEALITRAGVRAITFITKRGEGSFSSARRIDPYFREQADWQFVASILEASRGEKLKIERAWIIRASKGARSLADVQANVKKAMADPKIRNMSADMYLTLDAYLEVVVPQIARVRWAPRVELAAGVNAMDLTALTTEMQHLVIKSSLDWVLEHGTETVVVVPEAWKFIPQGRGTPVKLAAAAFIRQGAALKNFLWLDSQDLGGIEKEILRSVPVWILGVQREANEIKRTLENIPAGIAKPSKADIATLELGQFFACWGKHAIRTYVQPAWMHAAQAKQVATHALPVDIAVALSPLRPLRAAFEQAFGQPEEAQVDKDEAARLTRENEELKAEITALHNQLDALTNQLTAREKGQHGRHPQNMDRGGGTAAGRNRSQPPPDNLGASTAADSRAARDEAAGPPSTDGRVDEALYQAIKARFIADAPALLKVVVSRPEIEVHVERHVLKIDGNTLRGRIARLIDEGFFDKARTSANLAGELQRRGKSVSNIELGNELKALVEMGFFTRDNKWFTLTPDAKVHVA